LVTKTILLLRHGHSEPNDSLADIERALSSRGRRDARRLGGLLRRLGLKPDLAVSSSAWRAQETTALVAGGSGYSKKVRTEPRLYEAKADGYLDLLRSLPTRAGCVLLVGHNPAIRQAAAALLGCFPEGLRLPPAALACLEAPIDNWATLHPGSCALQWLVTPEMFAAH
jgi:phosphohistidine phosphatase